MRWLLLIFALTTGLCWSQVSLSGFWQAPGKNGLYLRELPDGLEINGNRHTLGQAEEGVHEGTSAHYTASLARIPNGYRLTTRTLQTYMEEDKHINSGFLTEEDEYRLSADGQYLLLTITTRGSRENKASSQSLTFVRVASP